MLQERIAARRDRIKQRMDQARKMTKLLKIKNMMGFKVMGQALVFLIPIKQ